MIVWAIAFNTLREIIRNRILYSVVAVAAMVVAGSAIFGAVTIGDQAAVIKDFGLFSLSFFGSALAIVSGVSLLSRELRQKTIYNILSKPVERWQFLVGKFLGLALTSAILVSLMGIALIGFVSLFEGKVHMRLLQAVLFIILETTIISAVTIFFSSMVVTTILPGIFTLATYIAGHSLSYLSFFIDQEPVPPMLRAIIQMLRFVLPDLSLFNVADLVVSGRYIAPEQLLLAGGYTVAYCTALLVLASFIFRFRELQ